MDFPSIIIIGNDPAQISQKISDLAASIGNDPNQNNPDLYQINQQTGWGIDQVRELKQFVFTKPIKYATKLIIIHDAQNLGIESQNSLLKLIEEPPKNTYIILTARNSKSLLATIRSRCQIIRTKNLPSQNTQLLTRQKTISDNLALSESLSQNKDSVLPYLENQLVLYNQQLVLHPDTDTKKTIDNLIKAIKMIHANIDPRTALDWFLLN
jgi:DNA polymerase-3 subunit delta'